MGEVYKARDTRLDHTVAIKVLRSFAGDTVPAASSAPSMTYIRTGTVSG